MEYKNEEKVGLKLKGEIFLKVGNNLTREDVLNNPDRQMHNIIVNVASDLIAEWAFGQDLFAARVKGITHLAIGTGNIIWDPMNVPPETDLQTQLETELVRVASVINYVTPITFVPSANRTNIIDLTTTFAAGVGTGPLVEMGLFGGNYHNNDGSGPAANLPNGGTMINYKTMNVINKPATAELIIIWRLTF